MGESVYPLTTVAETGQRVMYGGLARTIDITAETPIPVFQVDFLDEVGLPHISFQLNPATGLLLIDNMEKLSRQFRWRQRSLLRRPAKMPKGEGREPRATLECGMVVNADLAITDIKIGRPAWVVEFKDPKSPIPGAEFEIEFKMALDVLKALKQISARFQWQRLYDSAAAEVAAHAAR